MKYFICGVHLALFVIMLSLAKIAGDNQVDWLMVFCFFVAMFNLLVAAVSFGKARWFTALAFLMVLTACDAPDSYDVKYDMELKKAAFDKCLEHGMNGASACADVADRVSIIERKKRCSK